MAADELIAAGDRWQRSYQAWQRAVEHRDRVIERAERRVVRATGRRRAVGVESRRRLRRVWLSVPVALGGKSRLPSKRPSGSERSRRRRS